MTKCELIHVHFGTKKERVVTLNYCDPRYEVCSYHRHAHQVDSSTPLGMKILIGAGIVLGLLLVLSIVFGAFYSIRQYERGIILRFGKQVGGVKEPGLHMKVPFIDRLETVNVQVKSLSLEAQQVMSKESVSLKIVAVVFYKVSDAVKAIVEIEDFREAVDQYGQAIMRKQIGQHTLEETLHTKKTEIANQIKSELDETVGDWGIEITKIELKDIGLPKDMARSMASKAEAEREAEAKVIAATGEYESAEKMAEAAKKLESEPGAMQLRWMQTLREVATEGNTIVVTQQGSDGGIVAGAAAGAAAGSGGGTPPPSAPTVEAS